MSGHKNVSCTKTHPHCQTAATDEDEEDYGDDEDNAGDDDDHDDGDNSND